jgi:HAD superfamily hydrolase (TIGR01549 family)
VKRVFHPDQKSFIIFDLNDTLIDTERTFDSGFKELVREMTGRWVKEHQDSWSPESILTKYKAEWRKKSRSKKKAGARLAQKHASLRAALQGSPVPVSDRFARQFFRDLKLGRAKHAVLLPGVKETVSALSNRYKLAVITNGGKEQTESILERKGLLKHIPRSHIFASTEIGLSKPNPLLFQHALKTMGAKPAQTVVVGNSWRHDIYGATRAGIDAVWLNSTNPKKISQRRVGKERVFLIRKFEQLRTLFR